MQFNTLISNILSFFFSKSRNKWHRRPFESQFWLILTVPVILCWVQHPRCPGHLKRSKYCLFAPFWCINHFFCQIVYAQCQFVFRDFGRQCTAYRLVLQVPKILWRLCYANGPRTANYYEHVSDLLIRSLVISVILQDRGTTMMTCPHS